MITEQQAEAIVERLIKRVEEANTYFLESVGSSIKQLRELAPSDAQKLVQILKYGGNYEDIVRELSKYTNLNIKDIDEIFDAYAKKDLNFAEQFYKYRDIPFTPFEQNEILQTQTNVLKDLVKREMYNFSRTNVLGYTIKDAEGKLQFMGLQETYNRVLDEALLYVGQGKETFDSAMGRVMKEIGGSGLKTLEYESGRAIRLDSAVRMHLKGRLRELHNENQRLFGEQFDADGVEITVHSNPAPDHAPVQGRQFSNEEFEKLQNGEDATDYLGNVYNLDHDSKNGYRPISEMNCYHYIFNVVLGVSKPQYSDKQLQKIIDDNEEGFDYNGKHYTNYEGTQLQRKIERSIREQKDLQILAKASGNEDLVNESQEKIRLLTRKYQGLSNVSGLPTKFERTQVEGYKAIKPKMNNYNEIQYAKKNNKIWHSTENLEEIIKDNKIISPSIAVGKTINSKVKYGTQFIEFKPELLENVNDKTILYNGDGGNAFAKPGKDFDSLMEMLKNDPKYYNELKFNDDLDSLKYIKEVHIREDEPQEIINLLDENNIKYTKYKDSRIRPAKKRKQK